MTEPDFEQIAQRLVLFQAGYDLEPTSREPQRRIAEVLRQVWNARGAADSEQVEELADQAPPFPQVATYIKYTDAKEAIKALDR